MMYFPRFSPPPPMMSGKMEMSQRIYQGMEILQCEELNAGDED